MWWLPLMLVMTTLDASVLWLPCDDYPWRTLHWVLSIPDKDVRCRCKIRTNFHHFVLWSPQNLFHLHVCVSWLPGGNWMHILCGTNICRGRKGASCENKLHRMWTSCAVWRLFSAQTLSAWLLGGNWMHILCGTNIYRGRKGADIYFQHIQTFIFSTFRHLFSAKFYLLS